MRHRRHACASQGKEIKSGNRESGESRNQGNQGGISRGIRNQGTHNLIH